MNDRAARDRFYVQKDRHQLFQRLSDKEVGVFEHLKDVFVFAAALGYRHERRRPIESERQHVGFWHYLSESRDVPLLQSIAVAETGGLEVLGSQNDIILIAEEYANGGIELLEQMRSIDRDASLINVATEVLAMAGADVAAERTDA